MSRRRRGQAPHPAELDRRPALVANAADPGQVANATRVARLTREQELADLRALLATGAGRRFLWRLLAHTQSFGSTFAPDPHRTAYNAGRQDVGHFVLAEITAADESALLIMMQEAKANHA